MTESHRKDMCRLLAGHYVKAAHNAPNLAAFHHLGLRGMAFRASARMPLPQARIVLAVSAHHPKFAQVAARMTP